MTAAQRSAAGRIHDPLFIFMVAAMILAVISSIALRAMVSGTGPASAHAADNANADDFTLPPGAGASQFQHSGVK